MAGLTDSLRIIVTADGAQAEREFQKVGASARRNLGQAEQATQRWSRSLTSAGIAAATFGGVALVGLVKAAQAADEENQAILRLNNSIANSPALVGANTDAFLEQAAALQDTTTFADDATISAQAMLATYRLNQDQILQLTPLVQDLAAKFGVDLVQAATAVGKAAAGNTGTLRRWGVFIDEGANSTENFDNLLTGLRENAGGFAAQQGASFSGQLTIMKNNLGDVAEGIGQGVIPALQTMMGPIESATDRFTSMSASNQRTIGMLATFGATGLVAGGGALFLAGQALNLSNTFAQLSQTTIGTRVGLLLLNPAFQLTAAAAGVAALAAFGNSLNDVKVESRAFAAAADEDLDRVARQYALFQSEFGGDSAFDALSQLAEQDIAAAERFGEALKSVGMDAARVDEILRSTAEANLAQSSNAESAAAVNERLAGGFTDSATAAEDMQSAIDALSQEIDQYLTDTLGIGDAQDALQSSFNDLYAQLLGGNRAFRGNSDAAIQNREALDEIVRGTAELIDVQQQQGAGERALQQTKQRSIERIRRAADMHLIERGAARQAIAAIRGIPARGSFHLTMTSDNTDALNDINAVYQAAVDAGRAVGQIGGSLAGGGTYSPPAQDRSGRAAESAPRGRRRARPQEVLVLNGAGL